MRRMTEDEVRRMFVDRGDEVKISDGQVAFRRFGDGPWRFGGFLWDYVTNKD